MSLDRRDLTNAELYWLDDYRVLLHGYGFASEHSMRLRESTEKKTLDSDTKEFESKMRRKGISANFKAYTRPLTLEEFKTL